MKKRILSLAAVLVLVCAMSVPAAASIKVVTDVPELHFSGTTAYCSVDYRSGNSNDALIVTLTLWNGGTQVASWSDSGNGRVVISESCAVQKGVSYRLVLTSAINGVSQPAGVITGTC